MKLEILMSCMHQKDNALIHKSRITGAATVVNQCDENSVAHFLNENGTVTMHNTTQRGLTKSRNMAIRLSDADICLLCDDDEVFVDDYEAKILNAYQELPQADVVIFKMVNREPSFADKTMRLRFPKTMKVSSWQISFRRKSLLNSGVWFDELLGAGSGNGAEEELKFLLDCEKAGLRIWYVPEAIASVGQMESTWFEGFTEQFFVDRGATTRYILGAPVALLYAVYYVIKKQKKYRNNLTLCQALHAMLRGMAENRITKQAAQKHLPDKRV